MVCKGKTVISFSSLASVQRALGSLTATETDRQAWWNCSRRPFARVSLFLFLFETSLETYGHNITIL